MLGLQMLGCDTHTQQMNAWSVPTDCNYSYIYTKPMQHEIRINLRIPHMNAWPVPTVYNKAMHI